MKRFLIVLGIILVFSCAALSQVTDKGKQSAATLDKMRQIDLLNHLVPLAMNKDQIRKVLPVIEKARRDVRTQEDEEAKFLSQSAAKVDKAVENGIKGDVPDKQLLRELNAMIRLFSMKRKEIGDDNAKMVMEVAKTTFNAGQLKAMANSLDFKVYYPGVKPEEVKDEDKINLFIREILLDPLAYDLLVKMQAGPRG
ncbi:MAG: hypothetical protein H7Y17_17545 [Chlorobia bacterium]|nr:hypothetical protein [Fimbriimonadaceae bacterium]